MVPQGDESKGWIFVEEKGQRDRRGQFLQTIFAHPVFFAGCAGTGCIRLPKKATTNGARDSQYARTSAHLLESEAVLYRRVVSLGRSGDDFELERRLSPRARISAGTRNSVTCGREVDG